jgi:hypothetical protein
MGRTDRPENAAPPEIFYNEEEARKYTENSRMVNIQTQLTERALELLALPDDGEPKLLLDLGCGSGLSGETLTDRGHIWMVRVAAACPELDAAPSKGHGIWQGCAAPAQTSSAFCACFQLPLAVAAAGSRHQPRHA